MKLAEVRFCQNCFRYAEMAYKELLGCPAGYWEWGFGRDARWFALLIVRESGCPDYVGPEMTVKERKRYNDFAAQVRRFS